MSVGEGMAWEVFFTHEADIHAQVRAILAARGGTRRRFRVAALYEKTSGNLVAEVVRTSFGPVVVSAGTEPAPTGFVNGRILVAFRRSPRRQVVPFTGDDEQFFQIRSGDVWHTLRGSDIRGRVSPGGVIAYR